MPLSMGIFFFRHRQQSKAFVEACLLYTCVFLTFLSSFANYIHWLPLSRVLYLFYPFASISIVIFYFFYLHYFTSPGKDIQRWWYFSFCVPLAQFFFSGYVFYLHYPRRDMLNNFYAIVNTHWCPPMELAIITHRITSYLINISLGTFVILSLFFIARMMGQPADGSPDRYKKEIHRFLLMLSISFSMCIVTIYYRYASEWRVFMECFWNTGLLCTGYLMYKNVTEKQTPEKPIKKDAAIHSALGRQVLAYFEENEPWRNPRLKVEDVASAIFSNRHYISKMINQEFNVNFNDFVNRYRVAEAIRLLLVSKTLPKSDGIARQSGFNSYSAYVRAFRKEKGLKPMEYLKLQEKQKEKA
jgi:AraC-like DNA-binding protein